MTYSDFVKSSMRKDHGSNEVNHFFSSRFSKPVAYTLHRLGLSANAVTFAFLIVGISASLSVYAGLFVLAFVLWRLHIILDMADGDVARATKVFSDFAIGFDRTNHIVINSLLLFIISHSAGLDLTFIFLLITFQMYYNFDRNFGVKLVGEKIHLSQRMIFVKNLMTLEGYLLVSLTLLWLDQGSYLTLANAIYGCFFTLLFFYKFMRGFS